MLIGEQSNDVIFKRKFEILFREHFVALTCFARKYTGDIDSAREIVHSVFIRIWENRAEYDWEKPGKSYLFTSVYNRSMNYLRDNKKFVRHEDALHSHLITEDPYFSDNMETAELEYRIKTAIMKLPEKCRRVFELSRNENKKYAEIAHILNISEKTVEAQMTKALYVLKKELKDYLMIVLIALIKNMNNW